MDIDRKINSTPLTEAFNFFHEKDKALHGLKGILSGVVADKRLNEKEFLFLDAWMKSQQFLAQDPDALDILRRVGDILEDGQIRSDELRLMQARILEIIAEKAIPVRNRSAQMEELLGFVTGVASDGVLNDDEILAVSDWLENNAEIHHIWPATIIGSRLATILDDGIITDEERADLLQVINRVTGRELEIS